MSSREVRPLSTVQKPASVTIVTLQWYKAGIQFPAEKAPQNGSAQPSPCVSLSNLRTSAGSGGELGPWAMPGSCITGVPVCI